MILDVLLAKLFTGLAIVGIFFAVCGAMEGNLDYFVYGLCAVILFANLAARFIAKLLRY